MKSINYSASKLCSALLGHESLHPSWRKLDVETQYSMDFVKITSVEIEEATLVMSLHEKCSATQHHRITW